MMVGASIMGGFGAFSSYMRFAATEATSAPSIMNYCYYFCLRFAESTTSD
jgi:hypothetical protein